MSDETGTKILAVLDAMALELGSLRRDVGGLRGEMRREFEHVRVRFSRLETRIEHIEDARR